MLFEQRVNLMGSTITLKVDHPAGEQLITEAVEQLVDYQNRFNANNDASQLMQVNLAAGKHPVAVDDDLFELITLALKYSQQPGSYFNVAVGPLVKLWHIGFSDAHVPSQEQIAATRLLTDATKIELNPTTKEVYLPQAGMEIDLGGSAKGFFADQIAHAWRQAGVEHALINLGGSSIVTIGGNLNNDDHAWHIGLQDPQGSRTDYATILRLNNQAMSTSGVYVRKLEVNGQTYHHILDAQTGWPIQSTMASLTVLGASATMGEILTKMLFGHTNEEIQQILVRLNLDVQIITIDETGAMAYIGRDTLA